MYWLFLFATSPNPDPTHPANRTE